MLFDSIEITNSYPNEKIKVYFNTITPTLNNARVGVRFKYFYFDTWDSKFNFRQTPDYTIAGESVSAVFPTNFLNPSELAPFVWDVASDREYLYVSVLGGLSGVTVWPSHPYPKITKISDTSLSFDLGVVTASAFDGEFKTADYRKYIKSRNLIDVNFDDSLITSTKKNAYISKSRKNFEIFKNVNFYRNFTTFALGENVIPNSFRIDVPVVTSRTIMEDVENQIFTLTFFSDQKTNNSINTIDVGYTLLSCLSSETLHEIGISYPYTAPNNGAILAAPSGALSITFNEPFYIKPGDFITVSYETSSSILPNGITFTEPAVNQYTAAVNNAVYPNYPIYFFNLNFSDNTRDLATVTFMPSSFVTSADISSTSIKTTMIDNYYQTSFEMPLITTILSARFIETTNDGTLSAFDPASPLTLYKNEQWFPAKRNLKFINNGQGNKHTVKIQLKSILGAIYEEENELNFVLNKDKVVMNLSLTDITDHSATTQVTIFPTPDENYGLKWGANPSENIIFRNYNGDILLQDTLYPAEFYATITNLGVDKTEIILYSEEYDLSASTFWFPPSSIFGDVFLELRGQLTDSNPVNYGTLSATCNRNGYSYPVPTNANIIWNETADDNRGSFILYNNDFSKKLHESTIYTSSFNNSVINQVVSTIPVEGNPKKILFNYSCNLFREDFNLFATKIFYARQYPENPYLTINSKAASESVIKNSEFYDNIIYTSNQSISLSAHYPNLIITPSNLKWSAINSNGVVTTGTGKQFSLTLNTVSACVTLSGLSGKPVDGNFKNYNFTDKICYYNLSSQPSFDYIGFPSFIYDPSYDQYGQLISPYTELTFNNYTYSRGMSAYDACHTEYFNLCATPGFNKYVWQIGDKIVQSTDNKVAIPVSFANVSANNTISISAFNDIFLESDRVTSFNFVSSNNSTIFKQPVNFIDYLDPSVTISIDADYINTNKYSGLPTLLCSINNNHFSYKRFTFNIVLSSIDGTPQTKQITNDRSNFSKILNIGIENSDFIIHENSINELAVYLSGNLDIKLDGFDFCYETKPLSSNILTITAVNGPNLDMYTNKNMLSTGEMATFFNISNKNFTNFNFEQLYDFIFDNGDGDIQVSPLSTITTVYNTEGVKSPFLTAKFPDGSTIINTWHNMIAVKNMYETYDNTISREFFNPISLPHTLSSVLVRPNDWQYASTLNNSFKKLYNNFTHLSAMSYVNNINFPKGYGGFLGTRFGNFKWHTTEPKIPNQSDTFRNIKSGQIVDNNLIIVNENILQVYNIEEDPYHIYDISTIGSGEILENPTKIQYSKENNRLYILDRDKRLIFICNFDIDNPNNIQITHYWGGFGERSDRTKLNDPVDFCLDDLNNLYIVDRESRIVKVYNENLNWIYNIEVDGNPLSIHYSDSKFAISLSNGNTIITDSYGNIIKNFQIENSNNSIINIHEPSIVYVVKTNTLLKYTIDGVYITTHKFDNNIVDVIFDDYHIFVLFENYVYKLVDYVEIDSLIAEESNGEAFNLNEILVDETEFVADYVINDSLKKLHDNINYLNSKILSRINADLNPFDEIITQYISGYSVPSISSTPIFIASNEPVVYDVIAKNLTIVYNSLLELKENLDISYNYPNTNNTFIWRWKYHYVNRVQKPSLDKNPVTWHELKASQIIGSTELSSVSSWCYVREGLEGNTPQICWNFQQTQCNSYFPLSWEQMECGQECGYPLTWKQLEEDCCEMPDFIFADSVSVC